VAEAGWPDGRLAPFLALHSGAATLRRWAHQAGLLATERCGARVVSVGATSIGGAGKTPVAHHIAERLLARGARVAVVAGAYLGSSSDRVSRLDGPCESDPAAVGRFGDEAVMLAGWLGGRAPVFCGRDKLSAAVAAAREGAEVVVVDDGFQHLRLHRDLDIALVDGSPTRGLLSRLGREPLSAARAADLIWCHDRSGTLSRPPHGLSPTVSSRNEPTTLLGPRGESLGPPESLRGARVFLLAGVARPADFSRLVRALGATIVGGRFVADHARFADRHLREAASSRADLVLCTEKDLVRSTGLPLGGCLTGLACRVRVSLGERDLERRIGLVLS
jgi:tetraacyldisaccharide 4'-kinase